MRQHRNLAWEVAVFSTPPSKPVPITLLRRITGEQTANDIRVVTESVKLALSSLNTETRESRKLLAEERYAHLVTLKPFMDEEQLQMCDAADKAIAMLRAVQYADSIEDEEEEEGEWDEDEEDEEDDKEDEEAIPLTPVQVDVLNNISFQLRTLQGKLKSLDIKDYEKSDCVAEAIDAINDALDLLEEAME